MIPGPAERTLRQRLLSTFDPHDAANTAWAFAKLEIHNKALMAGLAERTLQEGFLATFIPQDGAYTT